MIFNTGIDIGTRNVRLATEGAGVTFTSSSAVAVNRGSQLPVAMGDEAELMRGRMAEGGRVKYPVVSGISEDDGLLSKLLMALLERARDSMRVRKINLAMSCSTKIRRPHRFALMQAALDAGADSVTLFPSDALAGLGAELQIMRPPASFVIEVGAGGMCAAIYSYGMCVSRAHSSGGLAEADYTIERLARSRGMRIGLASAEAAKIALGSAVSARDDVAYSAAGFNTVTQLPGLFPIKSEDVLGALEPVVRELASVAYSALSRAPSEIATDIAESGARLTGGGARLYGLDSRLAETLGIPVWVAENPENCVARGLTKIISEPDVYQRLTLESDARTPGQ